MSTAAKIPCCQTCTLRTKKKVNQKYKSKKRITYRPSPATAPKFDCVFTCTKKYRISELQEQNVQVLNTTAIASGYTGRDPQGGTSDGSFLISSLLCYKEWLKFFFQFFKRKEKNGVTVKLERKWQIEKVEKMKVDMYKEIEKD